MRLDSKDWDLIVAALNFAQNHSEVFREQLIEQGHKDTANHAAYLNDVRMLATEYYHHALEAEEPYDDDKVKMENSEHWYRNWYQCSECGHEWIDEWDCGCNDRCPHCDTEIEPYDSEQLK